MERITFSRQELYELVWKEPLLALAKKYNITDVGLRKVCLRMNIPVPQLGYWQKVKFGKKVKKIKLPPQNRGESQYTLQTREAGNEFRHGVPSALNIRQREIETSLAEHLIVPARLSCPVKVVSEARDYLSGKHAASFQYKDIVECGRGLLTVRVAPSNVGRALRFMDTLIKLLQLRGHIIEVCTAKTYAVINGQNLQISLKERLKKVIVPTSWGSSTEMHPTGRLYFKMEGYSSKEWIDEKSKIEDQLSKILATLELKAEEQKLRKEKWRKEEEEAEFKRQVEKESWIKKIDELNAFKSLLAESERWQKVKIMRAYIEDVELIVQDSSRNQTEFSEWIAWAKNKINWYDPYIKQEDELLADVDRETLEFKAKPPFSLGNW